MNKTLTLGLPPTANTYYRAVMVRRTVRHLISAAGREYRESVVADVKRDSGGLPLKNRLAVGVVIRPP